MWDLHFCDIPKGLKTPFTCLLPPPPSGFKVYGFKEAKFSQSNYDRLNDLLLKDLKGRIGANWNHVYKPVDIQGFIEGCLQECREGV